MAKADKNNADTTTTSGDATAAAPTASAGGQSGPPAAAAKKPTRFTIKATEKSGPVQPFAGVEIDENGVGTCDIPGSAYHAVQVGYDVLDGLNGNKPYTGAPPANKPVNG